MTTPNPIPDAEELRRICHETLKQLRDGDKRRTYWEGVLCNYMLGLLQRLDAESAAQRSGAVPENCKLIALHTGDGWHLAVENQDGDEIAILAWPESWPGIMTDDDLTKCGFEVV